MHYNYQKEHYQPERSGANVAALEARVRELESDKAELQVAIEDLNGCYQEKIRLLEGTIQGQVEKYEELLSWKQAHIEKSLFDVSRYEEEIKKMIDILDNAHHHFEQERAQLTEQLQEQIQLVAELRQENQSLSIFNNNNAIKIEQVVRTYTEEIDKLRQELRELRDESLVSEDESLQALREINQDMNQQMSREVEMGGFGDPILSKVSIRTLSE